MMTGLALLGKTFGCQLKAKRVLHMRHEAAIAAFADGATPAVIQRQLRHSDAWVPHTLVCKGVDFDFPLPLRSPCVYWFLAAP
jgi:hypothetical protein